MIVRRLSIVVMAGQTLAIDCGRIAERGSPADLLALDGAYRRLFDSQLRGCDAIG